LDFHPFCFFVTEAKEEQVKELSNALRNMLLKPTQGNVAPNTNPSTRETTKQELDLASMLKPGKILNVAPHSSSKKTDKEPAIGSGIDALQSLVSSLLYY
jgi:hypothetical protein